VRDADVAVATRVVIDFFESDRSAVVHFRGARARVRALAGRTRVAMASWDRADSTPALADVTNVRAGTDSAAEAADLGGANKNEPIDVVVDDEPTAREDWDGEGEGEATPEENLDEEDDDDEVAVISSVAELYRDESDAAGGGDGDDRGRPNDDDDDDERCPVCDRALRSLADTPLARVAHVNACLDDETGGWEGDEDDEEEVARDDALGATWDEGGEGEWHDVAAWCHAVDQPSFAPVAVERKLTFDALERLTDEDLRAMGVGTLGARKRLRAAIEAREVSPPPPPPPPTTTTGAGGWHPTREAVAVAPVFAFARGEAVAPSAAPSSSSGSGRHVDAPPSKRRKDRPRPSSSRYVPAAAQDLPPPPPWIRVPGTTFIVDGFRGYGKSHSGWCKNWFLTHFHADHYAGLTRSTPSEGCVVWCSRPTARLCQLRLGISKSRLRAVDVGRDFIVEGVKCRFVHANHCPGAVMIVFDDIPGGGGPVLATGDCRFHASMTLDPGLLRIQERRPAVMLDTTYCDPKHAFPPQEEVLKAVAVAVKAENFNPKCLFLFGTYTIGKERVFFEAAKALGKKVYVGKQKRQVLDALGDAIDKTYMDSVTTDDTETNLHVVPMGSTSFARMKTILRYYKNRYDTVIAFKPTGWTFEKAAKTARATKRTQRGSLIQYALPYSEHSSFTELRAFMRWLKPRAILPHVGNDRGPKAARMVRLLTAPEPSEEGGEARADDDR